MLPPSLRQCARYGEAEEVAQLLGQGTPVDAVDDGGRTALFFAAGNGHAEVLRLLLAHGAVRALGTVMLRNKWRRPMRLLPMRPSAPVLTSAVLHFVGGRAALGSS